MEGEEKEDPIWHLANRPGWRRREQGEKELPKNRSEKKGGTDPPHSLFLIP